MDNWKTEYRAKMLNQRFQIKITDPKLTRWGIFKQSISEIGTIALMSFLFALAVTMLRVSLIGI